jgi:PST family polysaccharide transporter
MSSPENRQVSVSEKHTYGQILKSSALIGASTGLNIVIGILRTKAMAVFLGPAGFGLMGLYNSIVDLVQSVASLGIKSSGVRQIAEAVGSGDAERIARTVVVLRRISIILGLLGAVPLIVFSKQVSILTFGGDQYTFAVALLSAAVFFRCVSSGQGALIQGMRRITDLAKMSVLGALYGTIISIPLVYFLREDGVVPALVGVAAMGIITSWWYSRKVQIKRPALTVSAVSQEAAALLKLGFAFMASGLMMMGSAYAIRLIVLRTIGFEALGLYQSAWTLGGLYVGFILGAMGTDFYPRLTAIASDNTACNRMVNEQVEVSLLLAGPGVIATLTFAPLVIALFYTVEFAAAVDILRWICLGMALRVISWPMGFIILAKGAQKIFFWTEFAWTVVYIGLTWVCVKTFDLNGTGMAFFGSYVFHGFMIYPTVRWLSGFRWSIANRKTGALYLSLIAMVFCGFYLLPPLLAYGVGTLAVILSSVYAIRVLLSVIPQNRIPHRILRLLVWFRLAACEPIRVYEER